MKTAREYWFEKFEEYPQTDADKLAVAMMTEYLSLYLAERQQIEDANTFRKNIAEELTHKECIDRLCELEVLIRLYTKNS